MIQNSYYATSLKKHTCLDKPARESEPITQAILQLENAYVLSFGYKCELKVFSKFLFICNACNVCSEF